MGNCKSEITLQNSKNNFLTERNVKPLPKAEDIFLNIVKIQSFVRGHIVRRNFTILLNSKNTEKLIQNLHSYARQVLYSRELSYDVFDYSSYQPPNVKPLKVLIKKLETEDSKIKYYGEWFDFFVIKII